MFFYKFKITQRKWVLSVKINHKVYVNIYIYVYFFKWKVDKGFTFMISDQIHRQETLNNVMKLIHVTNYVYQNHMTR